MASESNQCYHFNDAHSDFILFIDNTVNTFYILKCISFRTLMCIVLILFSYGCRALHWSLFWWNTHGVEPRFFLFHFLSEVLFLSHLHYSSFVRRIPIKRIQSDGRQSSWDKKETATFVERMSLPAWALSHLIYFSSPCLCTSLFLSQPQLALPAPACR